MKRTIIIGGSKAIAIANYVGWTLASSVEKVEIDCDEPYGHRLRFTEKTTKKMEEKTTPYECKDKVWSSEEAKQMELEKFYPTPHHHNKAFPPANKKAKRKQQKASRKKNRK